MRRVALAGLVVGLAAAPLALGAVPLWTPAVALAAALALMGAVGVWRAPGLALVVGAVGLALAVADLASRPLVDTVFIRAEDRYARLWRTDPASVRYDAGVDTTWETVGDLAGLGGAVRQPRTARFTTDALGFRSDPLDQPAQVALLGDSFAAGVGTDQDHVAATLLTTRYGLPTVNLGVSGASPYDEAVTLAAVLGDLDLAPDAVLVWMLFAGNDFDGECRASLPSAPGVWSRARARWATLRARSVIGQLARRLRASPVPPVTAPLPDGTAVTFYRPDLDWTHRSDAEVRASAQARCVRDAVGLGARLAERAGLRLVIAVAPMKVQVHGRAAGLDPGTGGAASVLRAFGREVGADVVDLEPPLAGAARQRLVYWRDDTHWNAAGHAIVAQALADAIAHLADG